MFLIINFLSQLTGNMIFNQALGTSTIFISAKNRKNFIAVAFVISIFTTLGSAGAYFVEGLFTGYFENFRLFVYVFIIGAIYITVLALLFFIRKQWFEKFRKYIHIASFNCAVMGTLYMIDEKSEILSLSDYLLYGIQSGLGFIIASFFMMSAYKRLNSVKVPSSFRGMPAMLVYIGIISMAIWTLK